MANTFIEITPEMIKNAERLAARGLNVEQIAYSIGLGKTTLYERLKENKELSEAIKRGNARGIATIANCLYENAKGGNTTAQIFYLKCRAKWKEEENVEKEDNELQNAKNLVMTLKGADDGRSSSAEG